jgi:hypothetical protein
MSARIIAVGFVFCLCAWPLALTATEIDSPRSAGQGAAATDLTRSGWHDARAGIVAVMPLSASHPAVIRQFIDLIDKHRVGDALSMMGPELVPNTRARADWARQFSAITSIRVLSIHPADLGDNGACFEYRVTLEVHVSAQAANAPIPNYGWGRNPNFRWITLCPSGGQSWRISSFATGP